VNEAFLNYLWQFQYFDKKELTTTSGESILVKKTGILNFNSGPDFLQSIIIIQDIEWVGTVEVHIKSSDWFVHKHENDLAYENVILHLVWEDDKPVIRKDGTRMPTLSLKSRVSEDLISNYRKLLNNSTSIPCSNSFDSINSITKISMIEKALTNRLENKSQQVLELLNKNKGDWEETIYQIVASNYGFKVNKEPFLMLSKNLPFKIIQKHRGNQLQVEALLFGHAGMLVTDSKDEYISRLYQEYKFLSNKYDLTPNALNHAQWKFLRLRPSNFPTLRIAQFASLMNSVNFLFAEITESSESEEIINLFKVNTSDYWKNHYRFGKKSSGKVQELGEESINNIIINSVAPILVAVGKQRDDQEMVDRAVALLQSIPGEKNKIVKQYQQLGYSCKSAVDSQGLIELFSNFCQKRQCLNCSIGTAILKPH
jgi:hypothetical protein